MLLFARLATAFMAATSLLMIFAPRLLIAAFLDTEILVNAEVVGLPANYFLLAALFQIVDGAQAVGGGMLRGLHDARAPMLFALVGYWGIGLPLGVVLAFGLGFGGTGIWIGAIAVPTVPVTGGAAISGTVTPGTELGAMVKVSANGALSPAASSRPSTFRDGRCSAARSSF